jgi:hypothetical protein
LSPDSTASASAWFLVEALLVAVVVTAGK